MCLAPPSRVCSTILFFLTPRLHRVLDTLPWQVSILLRGRSTPDPGPRGSHAGVGGCTSGPTRPVGHLQLWAGFPVAPPTPWVTCCGGRDFQWPHPPRGSHAAGGRNSLTCKERGGFLVAPPTLWVICSGGREFQCGFCVGSNFICISVTILPGKL